MAKLFFALWPSEETRIQLDKIGQQFSNESIKLVKKSNLHITLAFLGSVSDEIRKKLISEIDKLHADSFSLELTHVGCWRKPQILWIGTNQIPEPLLRLVKSIEKCVELQGLKTDQRKYQPHVTIARKVKETIVTDETFRILWLVESFALVVSESGDNGVEYKVIKEWPLIH